MMASGPPEWPTPMKAIGAQNLLTMPGGVTIAGYLHKRGGNQVQLFKWPLRYVIIHKGCVYYFKTSTSASSQGTFSLNGYNRVMRAAEETTSNNVFPFKIVHISKKHRTWYFSAASEEERKKWMIALRKEIDFYHEKKETITDLSDSGSESDSSYGPVERPVSINYVQSLEEDDSWQDDEEDNEDSYVTPDTPEDDAPSYPPPPVPKPPEDHDPRRTSVSSNGEVKPRLRSPSRGISELDLNHKMNLGGIPPPIPTFPPAHKVNYQVKGKPPPPLPPSLNTKTDSLVIEIPHFRQDPPYTSDPGQMNTPPSIPKPPRRVDSEAWPSVKRDVANCQIVEPKHTSPQHPIAGNDLKQELNKRLRNTPPSLAQPKSPPEKPQNKPSHVPPPVPASKPSIWRTEPPPVPKVKPSETKVGPPTILPRAYTTKSTGSCNSPNMRSPPDGQSFIDKTVETPIRPPRPKKDLKEEEDSDSDYEKVPLPASVYVDTCDSADVERMFKDVDPRGHLNGQFCIRNSARSGKVIVVWDKQDGKLRNYRIYEKETKVYLEGDILFSDIATLVEHYYEYPLPGHSTLVLKYAYGCASNNR